MIHITSLSLHGRSQVYRIVTGAMLVTASLWLTVCVNVARANEILIEDDQEILKTYEFICDNKLELAKARVSKLLKTNKNNVHLLSLKAYIETELKDYKQVEIYTTAILKQDPKNIGALARRGYALLNLGKYKEGIADLDKLLIQVPEDYPNLLNRSKAHSLLGHKTEAARDYNLAGKYLLVTDVSLAPNKEILLQRLKEINDCLDETPKAPYLLLARAKCFYRLKKFNSAIKDATAALIADPSVSVKARYQRAKIYLRQGNSPKAISDLTYVISMKPEIADWNFFPMCPGDNKKKKWRRRIVRLPDVYVDRARAYSKEGQYARAIKDCVIALKMDKYNLDAILVRGAAYDASKKYAQAAADYSQAAKLSNNRKDTVYMLTRSLQKLNQVSAGRTDLLVSLTSSLQDQGRHKEALDTVSKLLATHPDDKSLYKAKIRSLIKLKRYWSAVTDADKLVKLDRKDPESYILRGDAELALKEYENAIKDYTSAMKMGGGTRARAKRAIVYKNQGNKTLYEREMSLVKQKR